MLIQDGVLSAHKLTTLSAWSIVIFANYILEKIVVILIRRGCSDYVDITLNDQGLGDYLLKSRIKKTAVPIRSDDSSDRSINGTLGSSTASIPSDPPLRNL